MMAVPRIFGLSRCGIVVSLLALVGLLVVGCSKDHEHRAGDATHRAVGDGGHDIAADDPVPVELKEVLVADGAGAALDLLEELAAGDEGVKRHSHDYSHELGKLSYSRYEGDVADAFGLCDARFLGGCYHGVVRAYFENNPDFGADDIAGFCEGGVVDASATRLLRFECLHGLGHGLAYSFDRELPGLLAYCDLLKTNEYSSYCYGGVFGDGVNHGESSTGDLHYPCNRVAEKYKGQCYGYQPKAILAQNGRDFEKAFDECDKAPNPYVVACYRGTGARIATYTLGDPNESRELCTLGAVAYRIRCVEGVASHLIYYFNLTSDEAFDFCASVSGWAKRRCFEVIGEQLPSLHADEASRNEECAKAGERRWITICQHSGDSNGRVDGADG